MTMTTPDRLRMTYRGTGSPIREENKRYLRDLVVAAGNESVFPTYIRLADSGFRVAYEEEKREEGPFDARLETAYFLDKLRRDGFNGRVIAEEQYKQDGKPVVMGGGQDVIVIDPLEGTSNMEAGNENWGIALFYIKDGAMNYAVFYQPNNRLYEADEQGAFLTTAYNSRPLVVDTSAGYKERMKSRIYYNWWQRIEEEIRDAKAQEVMKRLGRVDQIRTFSDWVDHGHVADGGTAIAHHLFTRASLHDMGGTYIVQKARGVAKHGDGTPVNLVEHVETATLENDVITAIDDKTADEYIDALKKAA